MYARTAGYTGRIRVLQLGARVSSGPPYILSVVYEDLKHNKKRLHSFQIQVATRSNARAREGCMHQSLMCAPPVNVLFET
jgi:hypothetical protein